LVLNFADRVDPVLYSRRIATFLGLVWHQGAADVIQPGLSKWSGDSKRSSTDEFGELCPCAKGK
jgi:hypothetical protein